MVLRHRDPKQLARLYEQIVDASDGDGDAFVASETTRDFMARRCASASRLIRRRHLTRATAARRISHFRRT